MSFSWESTESMENRISKKTSCLLHLVVYNYNSNEFNDIITPN